MVNYEHRLGRQNMDRRQREKKKKKKKKRAFSYDLRHIH